MKFKPFRMAIVGGVLVIVATWGIATGQDAPPSEHPTPQRGAEQEEIRRELETLKRALAEAAQRAAQAESANAESNRQRQMAEAAQAIAERQRAEMEQLREAARQAQQEIRRQQERALQERRRVMAEELGEGTDEESQRRREFLQQLQDQRGDQLPPPVQALADRLGRQEERLERIERQLDQLARQHSPRPDVAQREEPVFDGVRGRIRIRLEDDEEVERRQPRRGGPQTPPASDRGEEDTGDSLRQRGQQLRSRMAELTAARDQATEALRRAELELRQAEATRDAAERRVREQRAGIEVLTRELRATATAGQKLEQRLRRADRPAEEEEEPRRAIPTRRERRESHRPNADQAEPI